MQVGKITHMHYIFILKRLRESLITAPHKLMMARAGNKFALHSILSIETAAAPIQQMRLMQTCQTESTHCQSVSQCGGQCEKANQLLIPSLSIKARKQSHEEAARPSGIPMLSSSSTD